MKQYGIRWPSAWVHEDWCYWNVPQSHHKTGTTDLYTVMMTRAEEQWGSSNRRLHCHRHTWQFLGAGDHSAQLRLRWLVDQALVAIVKPLVLHGRENQVINPPATRTPAIISADWKKAISTLVPDGMGLSYCIGPALSSSVRGAEGMQVIWIPVPNELSNHGQCGRNFREHGFDHHTRYERQPRSRSAMHRWCMVYRAHCPVDATGQARQSRIPLP